jgi:hypothetical protein
MLLIPGIDEPIVHHRSYQDFAAAVKQGCFVCNALLKSMPSELMATLRTAAVKGRGGRVSECRFQYRMGTDHFSSKVSFRIVPPNKNSDPKQQPLESYFAPKEGYQHFIWQKEGSQTQSLLQAIAQELTTNQFSTNLDSACQAHCGWVNEF